MFRCKKCTKSYTTSSSLWRHNRNKHIEKNDICKLCKQKLSKKHYLAIQGTCSSSRIKAESALIRGSSQETTSSMNKNEYSTLVGESCVKVESSLDKTESSSVSSQEIDEIKNDIVDLKRKYEEISSGKWIHLNLS